MRININNGNIDLEKKIKFSFIKRNSEFRLKNSKQEKNKIYTINFDSKKNLTPKNLKIQENTKENLMKSKTIYINKDIISNDKSNEKSNTFNSKSQSMTPPLFESDKLNKQKRNSNLYSDSFYQNELNEQEQLLSFHINDNKSNKKYKISNNKISTTKYNYLNFLPKGLLLQFTRLPNIFFLFTAIIQSIPVISPLTSLTAIIPLIFVLGVSMIREFIEDWSRRSYDDLNNKEEIIVLRDGSFIKVYSQSLRIGEIIIVTEGRTIPADMILIDSGLREGIAYVETSSLDGEKALKFKLANKQTIGVFSENNKREINFKNLIISGDVEICPPNQDLYEIYGKIKFFLQKDDKIKANNVIYQISTKEFILKGSILRNTNWIIGVIVYTGMNNKIILNSKNPRTKISKVEKKMNSYLIYVFIFLIVSCFICSFLHYNGYKNHKLFYKNFILIKREPS
jgi:magnesium-transporting ATPase (P-type)